VTGAPSGRAIIAMAAEWRN